MNAQPDLNVRAVVGLKMLAFMWIATGFTLIAFIIHVGLCCCCASRRDIKTGRRGGGKAGSNPEAGNEEKEKAGGAELPKFNRVDRNVPPSEQ